MTSRWEKIAAAFAPASDEQEIARTWLELLRQRGYLPFTCRDLLQCSNGTIATFYRLLAETRPATSPHAGAPDSAWMADADFCFFNIRATGLDKEMGTFIQAAKLLPGVRAGAIHIGPFTRYDFGVIYAVSSVVSIAPQVVDRTLVERGISPEEQVRAFVEAAHLLGIAVGFDVEPHVTQFSAPVLMYPELFRWIKLHKIHKDALDYGLTMDEIVREEAQARLAEEVRVIVQTALNAAQINDLDISERDSPETAADKEKTWHQIIRTLIDEGYWTILSHSWQGVGVPAYSHYNRSHKYPEFTYITRNGDRQTDGLYAIVTPFKFYHNQTVNRLPDEHNPPIFYPAAVDFYANIFRYWRDEFGFDFVRYDSVDHVFDSVLSHEPSIPTSDRPTPEVLQRCIDASHSPAHPHIGNLAERMGNEIALYGAVGFDLMMGTDMLEAVNRGHLEKNFWLYEQLTEYNQHRPTPFSIVYAVDTHDADDPSFWGKPLPLLFGASGMRLRYFLARFLSCGSARRPKYEVMGGADLSHGLHEVNVTDKNLTWVGDASFTAFYHHLEDIYETYRAFLKEASITERTVTDDYAWWVIEGTERLLIPVIAFKSNTERSTPLTIEINVPLAVGEKALNGVRYDFASASGISFTLATHPLTLTLSPEAFALFDFPR